MNHACKTEGNEDYITKFTSFLESRFQQTSQPKTMAANKSLSSQINKRLSKIRKPSVQDCKINHIMSNFKKVSTYIDIKDFIGQLRHEAEKKKDSVMSDVNENDSSVQEEEKIKASERSKFKKMILESCPNLKSIEYGNFMSKLKNSNKISHPMLVDYHPTDPFELKLYNSALNDEDHGRDTKKEKQPKNIRFSTQPAEEADQSMTTESYKKQLSRISGEMHAYLENMYATKWNKKKRNKQPTKQTQQEESQKPIMDIKYKYHAPRGVFQFVDRSKGKSRTRTKIKRRSGNELSKSSSKSGTNNRFSIKMSESESKCNSLTKPLPHLKQIESKVKQQRQWEKEAQQQEKQKENFRLLESMKKIKHRYNFKKPEIKNAILKRIVDFIDDLENSQYAFRKTNAGLLNSINKIEAKNALRFQKIIEDSLDVEEIKNRGNRSKKKINL